MYFKATRPCGRRANDIPWRSEWSGVESPISIRRPFECSRRCFATYRILLFTNVATGIHLPLCTPASLTSKKWRPLQVPKWSSSYRISKVEALWRHFADSELALTLWCTPARQTARRKSRGRPGRPRLCLAKSAQWVSRCHPSPIQGEQDSGSESEVPCRFWLASYGKKQYCMT